MTTVGESQFENLQSYTSLTQNTEDDQALAGLIKSIMETVPDGVTEDEVKAAINEAIADNPDAAMDEILETAVDKINQAHGQTMDDAAVTVLHDAWEDFKSDSGLNEDEIGAILADPASVTPPETRNSSAGIKQVLAELFLLLIELAGEESANQLLEGCSQRDLIKQIAQEKASDIRTKAWIGFGVQVTGAVVQVAGGGVSAIGGVAGGAVGGSAGSGISAGFKSANTGLGQIGGATKAVGGVATGYLDAHIAELDGEQQVAQANMGKADKMRQGAKDLGKALFSSLEALVQTDYQTMTAIGRI